MIIAIGILSILTLAVTIIWFIFNIKRINEVGKFRGKILDLVHHYAKNKISQYKFNEWEHGYFIYDTLPAFDEMVKSRKPLKFKNWIPEETLKILLYCE